MTAQAAVKQYGIAQWLNIISSIELLGYCKGGTSWMRK